MYAFGSSKFREMDNGVKCKEVYVKYVRIIEPLILCIIARITVMS